MASIRIRSMLQPLAYRASTGSQSFRSASVLVTSLSHQSPPATRSNLGTIDYHNLPSRAFHASPSTQLPIRRRRRGSNRLKSDDGDTSASNDWGKTFFLTNKEEFINRSKLILDKIETAFRPLGQVNAPYRVIRQYDHETPGDSLKIDLGTAITPEPFQVLANYESTLIVFISPVSGQYAYGFDPKRNEWRNTSDGHDMMGMITRDYIRVGKGVPKL